MRYSLERIHKFGSESEPHRAKSLDVIRTRAVFPDKIELRKAVMKVRAKTVLDKDRRHSDIEPRNGYLHPLKDGLKS